MIKKVNKIVVSAICVSWLCGIGAGAILAGTQTHTVNAWAYQKLGTQICLVDENGEKWQFEEIPFSFEERYTIKYYDGYILKELYIGDEKVIDINEIK